MNKISRVALAGLAVVVVGCGANNQASSTSPQLKLIDAANATSGADSAHVTLNVASNGGVGTSTGLNLTSDGSYNFTTKQGEETSTLTAPEFTAPLSVDTVEDGTGVYLKLPAELAALTGASKPWVKVDTNQALSQSSGLDLNSLLSTQGDPANQLSMLSAATKDSTVVGKEQVRGEPTTHYHATLDFQQAAAAETDPAKKASLTKLGQYYNNQTIPVDVWIDSSNRVRKIVFSINTSDLSFQSTSTTAQSQATTLDVTLEFYDFGTPVNVTVPPADQVNDITSSLGTRSAS
jgi:hypothetical protein